MTRDLLPWPVVCLVICPGCGVGRLRLLAQSPRKQKAEGGEVDSCLRWKDTQQWEPAKGIDYERTGSVEVRDEVPCARDGIASHGSAAEGLVSRR